MEAGTKSPTPRAADRGGTHGAIVAATAQLLRAGGTAAVTTRAVAAAAGVQAPTIYRLFGDKDGLLDAVAEHVFADYVADKADRAGAGDPVDDLRAGWEDHVGFGLAHPALFGLLVDPSRARRSPAVEAGLEVLAARVRRIAEAGRLRVTERRAVELVHAAGTGVVLTLLGAPEPDRDPALSEAAYDAVLRAIVRDAPAAPDGDLASRAVALRAGLASAAALSDAERAVMAEWLERIAAG
jgi:AcrR family transcriptional regulator